jgi:hypothetical protein
VTNVSWELRWFFSGIQPQLVSSWYEQIDENKHNIIHENSRDDFQLVTSMNSDNLGIKLRDERMEIKWRKKTEPFSFSDGKICGTAELWLKWSWVPDQRHKDDNPSLLVAYPEGPTVKITKKRNLRIYQAFRRDREKNNDHYLLRALPQRSSGEGCLIEITKLAIRDKPWWSIAFETFGSDDLGLLRTIASRSLSAYTGPPLRKDNSSGYPHWISSVAIN